MARREKKLEGAVKRFYAEKPNAIQLKKLGLSEEDYDNEPPYKVFEDCWMSLAIFMAMATQWRFASAGMAGVFQTGLDYSALPAVFDVYSVKQEEKQQVLQTSK